MGKYKGVSVSSLQMLLTHVADIVSAPMQFHSGIHEMSVNFPALAACKFHKRPCSPDLNQRNVLLFPPWLLSNRLRLHLPSIKINCVFPHQTTGQLQISLIQSSV